METNSKNKVKKVSQGHYTYKGLQIILCYGETENYWNIWWDENFSHEWAVGVPTKKQCINLINDLID